LRAAATDYDAATKHDHLERIPVRDRNEITLLPVRKIASVVADGELLIITTANNERYSINYRLKDLETRLDPEKFARLSRGTLVSIEMISRINPMAGHSWLHSQTIRSYKQAVSSQASCVMVC
jgi:DNA-binding LytR/AlgR family response regulator